MFTVIVTGSREYRNREEMENTFRALIQGLGNFRLVHGNAKGADKLAEYVCKRLGIREIMRYDADWDTLGKKAGPLRNMRMIDSELELTSPQDIIVLAFPLELSIGTWHCVEYALEKGIEVRIIQSDNPQKL